MPETYYTRIFAEPCNLTPYALNSSSQQCEESRVSKYVQRVCKCGCDESFLARASDVARGWGLYKNKSHASSGPNNPRWLGGVSTNHYHYKLRSTAKHPERNQARVIFACAIRAGVIKRGCCEFCGNPKTEGHHENYDRPLDVRWLCKEHHRMVDRWRRAAESITHSS